MYRSLIEQISFLGVYNVLPMANYRSLVLCVLSLYVCSVVCLVFVFYLIQIETRSNSAKARRGVLFCTFFFLSLICAASCGEHTLQH